MSSKRLPRAFFVVPLILLMLFQHTMPAQGQTYSMKLSSRRDVKPDWFGVGSQNTTHDGMYIDHPDLIAHIPEMNAKVIRFPSGGNANWWDWKTGWFVDDPNVPPHNPNQAPVYNTLENFKVLVDASGAVPLFDLNMISSTLQYQIEMLHYADSIGLQVKYVELGNEFYLDEESDSTYIYSIFPDAQTYGTVASMWIDSLHAHFPGIKVAAQGAFNRNHQTRRIEWDDDLLETLEGEDAITFHEYYNASGTEATGNGDGLYTAADVPEFLYRPFKAWNTLATEDLPLVRPGREVWITEYNLQDFNIPVHGSWGHSLFVATQSLLFLGSEKITNVNFHTICGTSGYGAYFINFTGFKFKSDGSFQEPPNPPFTTPWALTAAGNAIKIVSEAVNGMNYASQLYFQNTPMISLLDKDVTVSYPALYGWQFSNSNGSSAIIINLSANDLTINTADVFPTGGDYKRISADPNSYIAKPGNVITKTGSLTTNFTIKAYSINRITSTSVPSTPPTAVISANGPTTFCKGDSVKLQANGSHLAYLWSTGATTSNILVKDSGDYWLRVWDTQTGYWAADTITVTVHTGPPAPSIKNKGKDSFCAGESTLLVVKKIDSLSNYVWSTGISDSEITVTSPGSYFVTAVNEFGCTSVSDPYSVTVNSLPTPVITPLGATTFCTGESVVLDGGPGYKTYKWSNNKYGQQMTATETGTYSVTVTDQNNCVNTSAPVNIVTYALPLANVTVKGTTAFCDGTSSTYLVAAGGGIAFQWSKGANDIAGATDKKYYPLTSGTYKVYVTDLHGCSNKSSGTVITVLKKPKAKVTVTGPKNICNGETCTITANSGSGYTFQWKKNDIDIPGATQIAYVASVAGDYKVKVTDANGCKETSKVTTITSNCKQADLNAYNGIRNASIEIYPNPANDLLHVSAEFVEAASSATIEIHNLLGAVVYSNRSSLNGNSYVATISIEDKLVNGVYMVTVSNGKEVLRSRLVVSRNR